jgi:aminobenzoyl-glutamate transport protein
MPSARPSSLTTRVLSVIERGGNALPHPATLFAIDGRAGRRAVGVTARLGFTVVHPGTGETVQAVNLLSVEGLHRILTESGRRTSPASRRSAPCSSPCSASRRRVSGLIGAALRLLVLSAPRRAADLRARLRGHHVQHRGRDRLRAARADGGLIFQAVGRHPVAGLAAAFAGVSGGYSANLLLGTVDPLLAGLSEEAARIVDPATR